MGIGAARKEAGMDRTTRITLRSGHGMPALGLGTWKLTNDTAEAVEGALEAGYRLIDTASDYGSQAGIGEALRRTGFPREEIFVAAKIEETDEPVDGVLRDLTEMGLGYADLVLIHRPPADGAGEYLWEGLMRARSEGLVRDIGVSNYPPALVDQLAAATGETPAVNQVEWTPFGHDDALLDHHRAAGIAVMAYSPLTRGLRLDEPVLMEVGRRVHKTPAQVLLRWCLEKGVVPIPKANRMEHARENLDVFDMTLGPEDMARLDGLDTKWSALGELPYLRS
jgi:2,5-diketo-D-gluconate reductase A